MLHTVSPSSNEESELNPIILHVCALKIMILSARKSSNINAKMDILNRANYLCQMYNETSTVTKSS